MTIYRCDVCGADLRPTPEQIEALLKFGNPLRREPCLKTPDGYHRISIPPLPRLRVVDSQAEPKEPA